MLLHLYFYGTTVLILSQAFGYDNCYRTYSNNNGPKVYQCFPCEPGYIAIDDCPGNFTRAICKECQNGTYQPECVTYSRTASCKPCAVCDVYKENCTIYKDAICEQRNDTGVDVTRVWIGICIGILVAIVLGFVSLTITYYRRMLKQKKGDGDDHEINLMFCDITYNDVENSKGEDYVAKETTLLNLCETDINDEDDVDDCNETTPIDPNTTEKQIALVCPYDVTKSNDCKEVEHLDEDLQLKTLESIQVAGDFYIIQEGSEKKSQENQISPGAEDQSLSLRDLDKGTTDLQIDWEKVILQLSTTFSPTRWKLFAFHLLSNCQEMVRNVHDTADEIELETKHQHTEGWVIHAYIKVFNKWLDNVGRTNATFAHIKDAVSSTIEAKEASDLVLSIERNPPMKVKTPMFPISVPYKSDRTFRGNLAHSQQYMALHDEKKQVKSNCVKRIFVSSSETRRYQMAHCPCSMKATNELSNRETLVQLSKTSIETKINNNDTNIAKREQKRKRKGDQSTTQQHKRSKTEKYIMENAKQNLLLDFMPIRQNDYDMLMDIVIDLISNECHVSKEEVSSITYEGFCKAHQINTEENDTLYIIRLGKRNLCIGKEVYEDLAVYGNIARPKLLKHLEEKNIECDNTTLLFLKFEQMKNKGYKNVKNDAEKENNAEQNSKINCYKGSSIELCPDMNESEDHINIKPSFLQNSTDQLFDSEKNKRDISNKNTLNIDDLKPEETIGITQVEHGKKEFDNKAEGEQETVKNMVKDDKKDIDIKMELDIIKESFFPIGDETYSLPNAENVVDVLNKFMNQDLNNTPKESACLSEAEKL